LIGAYFPCLNKWPSLKAKHGKFKCGRPRNSPQIKTAL
jgi:hypothetical protein